VWCVVSDFPLAYGRAVAAMLAEAWRVPVQWVAWHVAYVEGRKPLCTIASLTQGEIAPDGRTSAPRRSVRFSGIDAEILDTDKPWRIAELVYEDILRDLELDGLPDPQRRWRLNLPPAPANPRAAAASEALALARSRRISRDEGRWVVEIVAWDGGRRTLFLDDDVAREVGLGD
jgi:hypothetical protein